MSSELEKRLKAFLRENGFLIGSPESDYYITAQTTKPPCTYRFTIIEDRVVADTAPPGIKTKFLGGPFWPVEITQPFATK